MNMLTVRASCEPRQALERRRRARYEHGFITAMAIVLCCVTGCVHDANTARTRPGGLPQTTRVRAIS